MSSVYARNRKESKWEPIIFAEKMRSDFLDFIQRNFGVKDMQKLVRKKQTSSTIDPDAYELYFSLLHQHRRSVYQCLSLLIDDLYSANVYPTTVEDIDNRRQYLNNALAKCNINLV